MGSLIPYSDFSQILKLQELYEHYKLHEAEAKLLNEDISLTEFWIEHFILDIDHEHQESDHEDLPFKHFSTHTALFAELGSGSPCSYNAHRPSQKIVITKIEGLQEQDFLVSIFQPPIV